MYNKEALIQQVKQLLVVMKKKTAEVENFLRLIEGEDIINFQEIKNAVTGDLLSQIKDNSEHPLYPRHNGLLSKIRYFDEYKDRVWLMQEFKSFIKDVEPKKAAEILKNLNQRIIYHINKGEVFVMKYSNSNKYTFYSGHIEWVEKKGKQYKLITGKDPEASMIEGLTPTQLNPDKIVWKGLQKIKS